MEGLIFGILRYLKEDHRTYRRIVCSCQKKAWKKSRLVRDSNLWPPRYRCSVLSNWANKPWKKIIEVIDATFAVAKRKREKISSWYGISFCNRKSCVYNCDDLLSNISSPRSSHIWFSFIHLFIYSVPEVFAKVYSVQFPSRLFSLMVCFPKVGHEIILLRTVSFKFSIIPAHTYA